MTLRDVGKEFFFPQMIGGGGGGGGGGNRGQQVHWEGCSKH
jgi:hypothetical protein